MGLTTQIGVYGGSFDPPHQAHVALAQAAIDQLALDELRIFPTGHAWHKSRPLSPAADRLAMARLAFAPLARVRVDERELQRAGPTYTVDTLEALRAEFPTAQLYLVIGADQVAALTSWHRWADIAGLATICAAQRASPLPDPRSLQSGAAAPAEAAVPTRTIQFPLMPISATDIRRRVAQGRDITDLVPPDVARYIATHHLYRNLDDPDQP